MFTFVYDFFDFCVNTKMLYFFAIPIPFYGITLLLRAVCFRPSA